MDYLIIFFRILALLIGLFSLYVAIFLYENEQGKIQSVLENLWIRISDVHNMAMSRNAIFMREVARLTESGFKRLFGKELLSFRSICVSACYCITSICLMLSYEVYTSDESVKELIASVPTGTIVMNTLYSEEYGKFFLPVLILLTITFFFIGSASAFIKKPVVLKFWFALVALSILMFVTVLYVWEYNGWMQYFNNLGNGKSGHTSLLWENPVIDISSQLINRKDFISIIVVSYCFGLCLGIASDVLFIVLMRRLMRLSSTLNSFIKILLVVISNCILAVLFWFGPALFGYGLAYIMTGHSTVFPGAEGYPSNFSIPPFSLPILAQGLQEVGYIASLSNVITGLLSLVFIVLVLLLLAHRFFWPIIERLVYALQKIGIKGRNKLFGTIGFLFLGLAWGSVPSWLKDILDKFI